MNVKRGIRVLGLMLTTAIALLASTAVSASAFNWDLNLKEISSNVSLTGNIVAGTQALLLVPAQSIVVHCTGFTVEEGVLRTDNTAHVRLKYTGCHIFIKGILYRICEPEILSVTAKIKPVLHNSKVFFLAEPLTSGKPFTVLHYNEATCALPPLPEIKGSVLLECYTGKLVAADCKDDREKHLIKPVENQALLEDALIYGLNSATLHGEAELYLTGSDSGKLWNALI